MSENDKNVPLIVCDFHMKWGKRDTLSFFSEEEFFDSLGTTNISRSLRLSVYIIVVLLINLPEQLKLCFYFKYSRSYQVL